MPELGKVAQTGDIVFVDGKSVTSALIGWFTFGKISHVAIVYDSTKLYETDGAWLKSRTSPIGSYDDHQIRVFRVDSLTVEQKVKIKEVCDKRVGTLYSYLACAVQALFFWANPKIKSWVDRVVDNSAFSKCDEETRIVLFKATGDKFWVVNPASNPQELMEALVDRKGITEVLVP